MFYIDLKGNQINCLFSKENEFMVDFVSFLTRTASKYQWRALEDADIIALERSKIEELYTRSQYWSRFGRLIAENGYLKISEREEMLHFLTPEERYKAIVATQPFLLSRVSLRQLSSYVGVKPESLSQIRKRISGKQAK